ncbi:MAG TPA: hypothetical protein VGI73_04740 [Solirubrobacterales bacterium]|jgi:hypothetical protein
MHRKPLAMATAVAVVLALACAASAQAAAPELHCTATAQANCVITTVGGMYGNGSDNHEFVFGEGAGVTTRVKCRFKMAEMKDGARFEATAPKTTTTVDLKPSYFGCVNAGVKVNVEPNGCFYRLHLVAASNPPTAEVDIVCPPGKATEFTSILECTITVPAQLGLKHIILSNLGSEPTFTELNITLAGISYSVANSIACPAALKGNAFADGKYTGTSLLSGYEDEGLDGSGNPIEGPHVGLHVF